MADLKVGDIVFIKQFFNTKMVVERIFKQYETDYASCIWITNSTQEVRRIETPVAILTLFTGK